ncbi:hypothetical protein GGR56DRAFT_519943 [Xylariaceae sp. FL0804]|nr:hypothetical protein GGR56DRAFT_519943 [Xylariaceae sp. FL0804]
MGYLVMTTSQFTASLSRQRKAKTPCAPPSPGLCVPCLARRHNRPHRLLDRIWSITPQSWPTSHGALDFSAATPILLRERDEHEAPPISERASGWPASLPSRIGPKPPSSTTHRRQNRGGLCTQEAGAERAAQEIAVRPAFATMSSGHRNKATEMYPTKVPLQPRRRRRPGCSGKDEPPLLAGELKPYVSTKTTVHFSDVDVQQAPNTPG